MLRFVLATEAGVVTSGFKEGRGGGGRSAEKGPGAEPSMVPLRGPRECHRAGILIVVSNPQSQMCRDMKWGVRRGRERGGKFSGKVTGTNFLPQAEEEHSPESPNVLGI